MMIFELHDDREKKNKIQLNFPIFIQVIRQNIYAN